MIYSGSFLKFRLCEHAVAYILQKNSVKTAERQSEVRMGILTCPRILVLILRTSTWCIIIVLQRTQREAKCVSLLYTNHYQYAIHYYLLPSGSRKSLIQCMHLTHYAVFKVRMRCDLITMNEILKRTCDDKNFKAGDKTIKSIEK